MEALWTERFIDFGTDPYLPCLPAPLQWISSPDSLGTKERSDFLKRLVSSTIPRTPGVYGMIDATGRLVYVGKSKALRNRLLSYFMPNNEEEKAGRIVEATRSIVWESQPSEFAALLREQCLIRRWQPRMNVIGMPNRQQQAFLCLGRPPAEGFYITRYFDSQARRSVGPLYGIGHLHRAVEILTRHFRLRDCSQKTPMQLSDQLQLFDLEQRAGCVRHELGNCLAPCISGCSKASYEEQVVRAEQFLKGIPGDIETHFLTSIEKASQGQHYEHASRLLADLKIIRWLSRRLAQFDRARNSEQSIYMVQSIHGAWIWYVLRSGGVVGSITVPTNSTEWKKSTQRIAEWCTATPDVGSRILEPEDTLGLVTSWLQKQKKSSDSVSHKLIRRSEIPHDWKNAKLWLRSLTPSLSPKQSA